MTQASPCPMGLGAKTRKDPAAICLEPLCTSPVPSWQGQGSRCYDVGQRQNQSSMGKQGNSACF